MIASLIPATAHASKKPQCSGTVSAQVSNLRQQQFLLTSLIVKEKDRLSKLRTLKSSRNSQNTLLTIEREIRSAEDSIIRSKSSLRSLQNQEKKILNSCRLRKGVVSKTERTVCTTSTLDLLRELASEFQRLQEVKELLYTSIKNQTEVLESWVSTAAQREVARVVVQRDTMSLRELEVSEASVRYQFNQVDSDCEGSGIALPPSYSPPPNPRTQDPCWGGTIDLKGFFLGADGYKYNYTPATEVSETWWDLAGDCTNDKGTSRVILTSFESTAQDVCEVVGAKVRFRKPGECAIRGSSGDVRRGWRLTVVEGDVITLGLWNGSTQSCEPLKDQIASEQRYYEFRQFRNAPSADYTGTCVVSKLGRPLTVQFVRASSMNGQPACASNSGEPWGVFIRAPGECVLRIHTKYQELLPKKNANDRDVYTERSAIYFTSIRVIA